MRIKEMITREGTLWLANSPCQHLRKCIRNSVENMHIDVRMWRVKCSSSLETTKTARIQVTSFWENCKYFRIWFCKTAWRFKFNSISMCDAYNFSLEIPFIKEKLFDIYFSKDNLWTTVLVRDWSASPTHFCSESGSQCGHKLIFLVILI